MTGLDWAKKTNRIVSCAQDRSCHVWNYDPVQKIWAPTLVLAHLSRAATSVRWNEQGAPRCPFVVMAIGR